MTLVSLEHLLPFPLQLFFAFLLGIALGSFGTMLLHRMPRAENFGGRSACPLCGHTLAWYDLFPLLSYLFLRGRCRSCAARISPRYLIVEFVTGALFVAVAALFRDLPIVLLIPLSLALLMVLFIAFYDAETQRIPDILTAVLAFMALLYQFGRLLLMPGETPQSLFFGALFIALFFGSLWIVSRGRWIGSGDILLGASLGALLGFRESILMLFFAYTIGAAVATTLLLSGKIHRKSPDRKSVV